MTRAYCAACGRDLVEHPTPTWSTLLSFQPCLHCLAEAAQAAIEGCQDHYADLREAEMEGRD